MINIYSEVLDSSGNQLPGKTKLFIAKTDEKGVIVEYESGISCTPQTAGTMFIIDDWLIAQLDKVQFINGELSVKDGEELIPPVKTEKEKMIEEMERQLAALKAEPAVTEENTDTQPAE